MRIHDLRVDAANHSALAVAFGRLCTVEPNRNRIVYQDVKGCLRVVFHRRDEPARETASVYWVTRVNESRLNNGVVLLIISDTIPATMHDDKPWGCN